MQPWVISLGVYFMSYKAPYAHAVAFAAIAIAPGFYHVIYPGPKLTFFAYL